MNIKIRNATEQDIGQMLVLANEIREHHRQLLGGYFKPQTDEIEKNVIVRHIDDPENNFAFVAVDDDNKVQGMLWAEKTPSPWLVQKNVVNISNIGVFNTARGHGIAGMLMDEFVKICKDQGVQEIKLGVYNKNEVARKFYQKYGFEEQAQRMSFKLTDL